MLNTLKSKSSCPENFDRFVKRFSCLRESVRDNNSEMIEYHSAYLHGYIACLFNFGVVSAKEFAFLSSLVQQIKYGRSRSFNVLYRRAYLKRGDTDEVYAE